MTVFFSAKLLLCILPVAVASLASEYTNSAALDEDGTVKFFWSAHAKENMFRFAIQAKTTGWVGFGLSSGQGRMKGADIVMGWVKDGKAVFSDRHGDGHFLPAKDESQDYELTGFEEKEGKTTLKFKRKINTCDPQDNTFGMGTTKVIFAYHPDDPSSPDDIPKHTVKGARSLMLLNVKKAPKLPGNLKHFDVLNNKTKLPGNDTTYWCSAFKIPEFLKKHHIVKIEPIIQKNNEGIVHHMLVFQCDSDFPPNNISHSSDCKSPNMPPAVMNCRNSAPIGAWGIGAGALYMPEHVGIPLGTEDSPKYVVLETHYDNPKMRTDIIDSSGLRFHYTETIRKYDAAILMTGAAVTADLTIPPKQESWDITGYCPGACTKEGLKNSVLPGGGVNVIATELHTHLAGRAARVRHIRDGVELPEIVSDKNYDFNFQEFQALPSEIHIKPGDELITICNYETSKRSKATLGGESTKEEMCLSFLIYYPKANLSLCVSRDLGFSRFYKKYFWNGTHAISDFPPEKWNKTMVDYLENSFREEKDMAAYCRGEGGVALDGVFGKTFTKTAVHKPYEPADICAEDVHSGVKRTGVHVAMVIIALLSAAFLRF